MGIDIGFTDDSLRECKYALCKPYREKIIGFYADVPTEGTDELLPYREQLQTVNVNLLKHEEPTIYKALMKDELPFVQNQNSWPWNRGWFGEYYTDPAKRKRIAPYVETKPGSRVLVKNMPKELAQEYIHRNKDGELISAWWEMPYDKHESICKPCPVRPLDEMNCYLRFSSYPGMGSFKHGFLLTTLYAMTINEDDMKDAWFSFPHLDKKNGELPRDKIGQLYELCQGVTTNKGAEQFFDKAFDVLTEALPEEDKLHSKIDMEPIPFLDEFLSKFIYREKPYSQEEIREVLPYLATFEEVADWAIWSTNEKFKRTDIISFKEWLDRLVTALKIGEKYGIEPYVSY
jgi:hypothetical protein